MKRKATKRQFPAGHEKRRLRKETKRRRRQAR